MTIGDEGSGENRRTSSSKGKNQGDEEKSTETKEDGSQESRENEKNQGKGKRGVGRKLIVDGKAKIEGKQRSVPKEKPKGEPSKTSKTSNNRQQVGNVLKTGAKVNSISKPTRKKAASTAKDTHTTGTETVNVTTNKNETMMSTLGSINSQLPVNTSTPKCKRAPVNDLTRKRETEGSVSGLKKIPFSTDASSRKHRATEICPRKDFSKRWDDVTAGKKKNTNASVNSETEKAKRKKENVEAPRSNAGKASKCSKQEEKNTETGNIFPLRLFSITISLYHFDNRKEEDRKARATTDRKTGKTEGEKNQTTREKRRKSHGSIRASRNENRYENGIPAR